MKLVEGGRRGMGYIELNRRGGGTLMSSWKRTPRIELVQFQLLCPLRYNRISVRYDTFDDKLRR